MRNNILFAAMALLITAPAWSQGLTISTSAEWDTFASNVNSGTTYSGQTIVLAADITITTGAGSSSTNSFRGTFEGGGHTLTLDLTHSGGGDAWIAPFRFINGATIKHLHTAGTITTDGKMAGGIVGDSWGTSTIQSCRSSVTISSSISGDGTHGGLVGRVNSGTLTLSDCLFDGSITGASTTSCGGFVGWKEASLVLNRCLQAGDLSGIGSDGGSTFCRYNSGSVDFSTCYYRTAYGTAQGTQTAATGSTLQGLLGAAWEVSGNDVLPIIDVKNLAIATISGISRYYIYTGSAINIAYDVTDSSGSPLTKGTHYTETFSPAVIQEKGDYTLTITAKDGSGYNGSQVLIFTVVDCTWSILKAELEAGRSVTLTNDVIRDFVGSINVTGTVTLDLNGYTIDGNSPDYYNRILGVGNGVSLTITDSRTGGKICKPGSNETIWVNTGGTLSLASGTIDGGPYGVVVDGRFIMTGGSITATTWCGVDLEDNGTFTMTGGSITGNDVGVEIKSESASFTVSGNVNITGNTTEDVSLYYYNDNFIPITIGGALNEAARIGINIYDYAATDITGDAVKTITSGLPGNGTRQNFVLNGREGHALVIDGSGELAITTGATINNAPETTVLGENKYVSTFYNSTQAYQLMDGSKAYTASLDGSQIVFHLIGDDGSVIPANTPVVIMSDTGNITLTKLASTTVTPYAGNILLGSDTEIPTPAGTVYVLNKSGDTLGFYKYTGTTIPAHKAYYVE